MVGRENFRLFIEIRFCLQWVGERGEGKILVELYENLFQKTETKMRPTIIEISSRKNKGKYRN